MKKTKRNIFIFPLIIAGVMVFFVQDILGQNEYYVHSRGMLHQTVYNNGMLARAFQPRQGEETALPLLEWPPRGATVVEGKEYSGQHNSVGGGKCRTAAHLSRCTAQGAQAYGGSGARAGGPV